MPYNLLVVKEKKRDLATGSRYFQVNYWIEVNLLRLSTFSHAQITRFAASNQ